MKTCSHKKRKKQNKTKTEAWKSISPCGSISETAQEFTRPSGGHVLSVVNMCGKLDKQPLFVYSMSAGKYEEKPQMDWMLGKNVTTFIAVISASGYWDLLLPLSVHVNCGISFDTVLGCEHSSEYVSDAFFFFASYKKETLWILELGAFWSCEVCDLFTWKGVFNFLFIPKEIQFSDVQHGGRNHECQQAYMGQIMLSLLECS